MSSHSWTVKNSTTLETRVGLDDAALVTFLTSIPSSEFTLWEAARSDQPERWISCSRFPAFRLKPHGFDMIPPDIALSEPQISWIEQQLQTARAEKSSWTERRRHPRKKMTLQVVLIQGQNAFRTTTRDISMGGMALEKPVPQKMIGTECMIFVSDPSSSVKFSFSGRVLSDESKPGSSRYRIEFQDVSAVSKQALEHWISQFDQVAKKAA